MGEQGVGRGSGATRERLVERYRNNEESRGRSATSL